MEKGSYHRLHNCLSLALIRWNFHQSGMDHIRPPVYCGLNYIILTKRLQVSTDWNSVEMWNYGATSEIVSLFIRRSSVPSGANLWNYEALQRKADTSSSFMFCVRHARSGLFQPLWPQSLRKNSNFRIITNQSNTLFGQYILFITILFLRHNYAQVKKYCKIKRYIYYTNEEIPSATTVCTL
jgi:hypothetical protein